MRKLRDFLATSGHLQQQSTHTREKPDNNVRYEPTLQSRESHYNLGERKKTLNPKHTLVQDKSVHIGRQCIVCSECRKTFKYKSLFMCTRESTLEKDFMCVVNVGNRSGEPQSSVCIKEFILGQGSTSAANVRISLAKTLSSFIPGEVTVEKLLVL